jgi:hypothetical protein
MTVSSTPRRAGPFTGAGPYPFLFKVLSATDVGVAEVDGAGNVVVLPPGAFAVTLNTDQNANPGGSVTYALPAGKSLFVVGARELAQTTDIPPGGRFPQEQIEATFDSVVILLQQMADQLGRALTLPLSSSASSALPPPAANNLLGWNATATALRNVDPAVLGALPSFVNRQVLVANGGVNQYTLGSTPGGLGNTLVVVNGQVQRPGLDYTLSGTTLTPTVVWPAGTQNVTIFYGEELPLGTAQSDQVSYTPRGAGARTRSVRDKLFENVSVLDFMTDAQRQDVTSNTGAIAVDDAFAAAVAELQKRGRGGVIALPPGRYRITQNIVLTWPEADGPDVPARVTLQGAGPGLTFIDDWRTTAAGDRGAITLDFSSYTGPAIDGRAGQPSFGGFSLIRRVGNTSVVVGGDGSYTYTMGSGTGLWVDQLPAVSGTFRDIRVIGYFIGVFLRGVLGARFERVNVQLAEYGFDVFGNTLAEPNSLTFEDCTVAGCRTWGYRVVDGGAVRFQGGVCQSNGQMVGDAGGLYYKASTIQNTGIAVDGVYFELNRGVADVLIDVGNAEQAVQASAISNSLFARNLANFYTTNNIRVRANGSGELRGSLTLSGNGHRGFNTYVPSSLRKYVAADGAGLFQLDVVHVGCTYESSVEDPRAFPGALHAPTIGVGNATAGITSAGAGLVLGGAVAVAKDIGCAPVVTNALVNGSPALRWSLVGTRDLDLDGTFYWGARTIAVPPGGSTQFLRADGTWAVPPGSGGGVSSITAGAGLTGGTITTTGTIALNLAATNTWTNKQSFNAGFNVGTGGPDITAASTNLVLNTAVAVSASTGVGPTTDDTFLCGGGLLRWASVGTYDIDMHATGVLTWGTRTITAPPGGTTQFLRADGAWAAPAGSGTVTSFSFTNGSGVTGTVSNATTTPALSLSFGAVTGTSFNGVTGLASNPSPQVAGSASVGTSTLAARQDHSHQLNTTLGYSWSAKQTLSNGAGYGNQLTVDYSITASATNAQIRAPSANLYISSQNVCIGLVDVGGGILTFGPVSNATHDLGYSGFRWKEVWATNGTINTSDARLKTKVTPLNEAELRAAARLAKEIGTFQWLDAVAEKGPDGARLHCGLTVQRAIAILKAEGLEPTRYAFICHNKGIRKINPDALRDDEYSFRFDQLLAFVVRGQEQRLEQLERAVASLQPRKPRR